ncbi:MAG TPA: extracellular solute-binding protein [Chloroflexota bacterium]|nr:extracellular solute-binding protein [Chloroflexota bacterium]
MHRSGFVRTLALSAVVTLSLVAAVGPRAGYASSAAAGTTISVAYSSQYVFDTNAAAPVWWGSIKKQYEKRYPGSHLTLIGIPGSDVDEVTKLNLMLRSASTTPDVMQIPTGPLGAIAAGGYLEPLNKYVQTWPTWKEIPRNVQYESAVNGQIYGVNNGNNNCGLFYDRPYFKKAGLPTDWHPRTWADVINAARAIKKKIPGVYPFLIIAGKSLGPISVLQGIGNVMLGSSQPTIYDSKTNKWVSSSSGLLDTFKFFHTLASEGLLGPTSDIFEPSSNFFTDMLTKWMPKQRYGMAIGCNWMPAVWLPPSAGTGGINWKQGKDVWGAVGMPTEFGQKPGIASSLGGWAYSMASASKHKAEAWNLIKLMEESQNSIAVANGAGFVPPSQKDGNSPAFVNFLVPYNKIFNSLLPYSTILPSGANYPKWTQAMNDTTGAMMQNPSMSATDALNMFNQEATQLIGSDQVETLK